MRTARLRRDIVLLYVGILLALAMGAQAQTGVIDPGVEIMRRYAAPDEHLAVIVRFHDTTDVRDRALRQACESLGASDIRVLWIIHSIAAKVPAQAISQLASLPGVVNIRLDEPIPLPPGPRVPKPLHFVPPCTGGIGGGQCSLIADVNGMTTPVPLQTVEKPADAAGPSVPTSLMVTDITQTTVALAWQASTDDVGVTGYRLYEYVWINHFVSRWALKRNGLTTLSATVTDLKPGVPHTYAVTAVNAAGNESARSVAVEVRTLQPPTAYHPTHSSNEGALAVVGEPFLYNVDALGHPAPTFSLLAGPTGMSVDAASGIVRWTPAAGAEGIVTTTVRATNSQGSVDHTFSVRVHPAGTDLIPPSAVRTAVATNITAKGCTLTWQAATDNAEVVGYVIMAQQLGRGESLFMAGDTAGPGTTHTITTLKPSTGYRLWVAAYDAAGNRATISGLTPAVIYTLAAAQ